MIHNSEVYNFLKDVASILRDFSDGKGTCHCPKFEECSCSAGELKRKCYSLEKKIDFLVKQSDCYRKNI